ncbi:MAG TPA: aminoacyl-tRNA hydrolase [Alphaproteobacteria bacterium]|nr:aminoacyl-tRNA hydrolase [Alphaproteobacteria bacterium]
MRLLVGLGNPGPGYVGHRHNIGAMAVDAIHRRYGFGPWRARFHGLAAEGQVDGVKILALKPVTYMNRSGEAVATTARFYKIAPEDIIAVYDEIDLKPGQVRAKKGGGAAGHNGIRSIEAHIGPDFWRIRLGIGHPGAPELVHRYVLQDFAKAERPWLEKLLDAVAEAFPLMAKGDENRFMNKVLVLIGPPKPKPPRPETGAPSSEKKDS